MVTRIPGFAFDIHFLEEMEIEILAGEALQGLFDFSFKGTKSELK